MNIAQNILTIIEQGRTENNLYYLPPTQLDRKTYEQVNKVLDCLGGKWNRSLKAHVFASDISGAIDDVLLTGEVIDKKKEFQFFETPPVIVAQLLRRADLHAGQSCLEPSAGRGNIATALREIVGNTVQCVELNIENVAALVGQGFAVHKGDFLTYIPEERFDRIVMNPPFTRQQDIQHVEHALTLLKPGGRLVSIMSAGVKFRTDKRTQAFTSLLDQHDSEMDDLPPGAFKVSGTGVNTIVLTVTV